MKPPIEVHNVIAISAPAERVWDLLTDVGNWPSWYRGTAAIWEIEAPRRNSRATSGDGAALFFRLTSSAGAYHGDDYARWLRAAGFRKVSVTRPLVSPGKVLVTARR